MYLSTLMLTGQGGPEGDLPWYTKGVVLLTGAFSIGMFAIPASMLTWGFEAEAARCAKRAWQLAKRKEMAQSDDWSSSDEDYSTDEEYQKIIAGEESDGSEDELTTAAIAQFKEADTDASGSISIKEYLRLVRHARQLQDSTASGENVGDLVTRIAALEMKLDDVLSKINRLCQVVEEERNR